VLARRTRRSTAARAGFRRLVVRSSTGLARRAPPAPVAYDFWRQFKLADELEEIRRRGPRRFARCRSRRMTAAATWPSTAWAIGVIVNQWVPAAHRGDAVGDNAARCATVPRWDTSARSSR
jgi:hypothetical protein